jgi:hypothetical protein
MEVKTVSIEQCPPKHMLTSLPVTVVTGFRKRIKLSFVVVAGVTDSGIGFKFNMAVLTVNPFSAYRDFASIRCEVTLTAPGRLFLPIQITAMTGRTFAGPLGFDTSAVEFIRVPELRVGPGQQMRIAIKRCVRIFIGTPVDEQNHHQDGQKPMQFTF